MTGFQFPPPPPPPPKATSNDALNQYASQRGRPNNARGGRGQGWQGRGRGNNTRGGARGGRGNAQQQRGGGRGGGHALGERGGSEQHHTQGTPTPVIQGHQHEGQTQPQVDPATFAQAMSFMSTPVGMQTFAAFASNMANGGQAHASSAPPQQQEGRYSSPEANKKRKRGEHIPGARCNERSTEAQIQHSKPKPPKAKAIPAPAIPSFGFSLPIAPSPSTSHKSISTANKSTGHKGKVRLGLTIDDEDAEEDQEQEEAQSEAGEDIDEESALASSLGVQGMKFEHNGVLISLQTPAEVADWIRDRKKQFPTRKRIAEKEQELAERREHELEFLRRVQGKKSKSMAQPASSAPDSRSARREVAKLQRSELDDLRSKVEASRTANNKQTEEPSKPQEDRQPEKRDLGLGYDSETESDDDILLEESSVVSSSEESDDSTDDSDSDSGPEERSSKIAPTIAAPPPPPPPKSVIEHNSTPEQRECLSWKRFGRCKTGRKCRFAHPPKEEEKPLTLYERLVEQEKEKADRLALDAIKWLGQNGFLG